MIGAKITLDNLRRQITLIDFELMESEPCEQCIKMRAVHLAAAVINGFDLKDFDDGTNPRPAA